MRAASLWHMALRRLFRQRSAIVGMTMLGLLVFMAIFAPVIAPYDPEQVLIGVEDVSRREPPCIHLLGCDPAKPQHLMGIDGNVRDLFSRVIYGARVSLLVGFTTMGFAIIVGMVLGSVAAYTGGWVDIIIMRIMDVILAFPSLLLALAIVAVLGPGLTNAMLAIGIVWIPAYARIIRASVLSIREQEFVEASQALGASTPHILFKRI
ncbi:MAG TPA: ABC transporter permease, partial [Chloroflexi bacterium]|nr:ABC transporter permease [Chloroflexota bacterium]